MGWLIALGLLLILLLIPIGISVRYEGTGKLLLLVGPFRFWLYPNKGKQKKAPAPEKDQPAKETKQSGQRKPVKGDIFPLITQVLDFLDELRQKLRVRVLELKLVLAGDDPADLAIAYGSTCAALSALEPQLTRVLVIGKKDLQVLCDFTAEKTSIYFRADITITIARILSLGLGRGVRILREYMKILKLKKGGAST